MITALIPSDRLLEQSAGIKQLTSVLVVICMILALALGVLISRQMSGTIHYILRQLRKVSNGDLTVNLTAKHKDEFGLLCDGVNDTVAHMKTLIKDVNEVSEQVGVAAVHVAQTSGTFMETSKNIQSAVIEIEDGVNKLDSNSGNCMNQMDSLSGKINNVSSNADEIQKLTNITGETISAGISSVQSLTESAESTAEITRNVITSIEELEEKSKSIGHIVSAINEIAEQTNLLSLNASIEAARAGEAGRGFGVVAEEIGNLSDQSAQGAEMIKNLAKTITEKSLESVRLADQVSGLIVKEQQTVMDTQQKYTEHSMDLDRSVSEIEGIAEKTILLSDRKEKIVTGIRTLTEISKKNAGQNANVNQNISDIILEIQNANRRCEKMNVTAYELQKSISFFHE